MSKQSQNMQQSQTELYHFTKEQIAEEEKQIRLAQDDPKQFGPLYEYYFEQIFMFTLKRVESKEVASEVTSEIFYKALKQIRKYSFRGLPFSSWLYRIARNQIYDMLNSNKLKMVLSVESEGIYQMISEFGEESNEGDYDYLYNGLQKLSGEELELIEFRFFEKRAFAEIGEILAITENNAKVRTYRVLDKLKNYIKR